MKCFASPPCRYFSAGTCTRPNCAFAHIQPVVCKYFARGRCTNANCPYLHPMTLAQPLPPLVAPNALTRGEPQFAACSLLPHRRRLTTDVLRNQCSIVFAPLCAGTMSRLAQYLAWELHSRAVAAKTSCRPLLVVEPTVFAASFATFTLREGLSKAFANVGVARLTSVKHVEGEELRGVSEGHVDCSVVVTSLQGLLACCDATTAIQYSVVVFDDCHSVEAVTTLIQRMMYSPSTSSTCSVLPATGGEPTPFVVVQSSVTTQNCIALNKERLDKIKEKLTPITAKLIEGRPPCVLDLTTELTPLQHMSVTIDSCSVGAIGDPLKAPSAAQVVEAVVRCFKGITGNMLVLLPTPFDVEVCANAFRYREVNDLTTRCALRGSVSLHEGIAPDEIYRILSRDDFVAGGVVIFCTSTMATRAWCFSRIELVIDSAVALVPVEAHACYTHAMEGLDAFDCAMHASLACGGRCVQLCAPVSAKSGMAVPDAEHAISPHLAVCGFLDETVKSHVPGKLSPCEVALGHAVSLLLRYEVFLDYFPVVRQQSQVNRPGSVQGNMGLLGHNDSSVSGGSALGDEDETDSDSDNNSDNGGTMTSDLMEADSDVDVSFHFNGDLSKCILLWIKWREVPTAGKKEFARSHSISLHAVTLFDTLWTERYGNKFVLPTDSIGKHLKPIVTILSMRCNLIFAPFESQACLGVVLSDGRLAKVSTASCLRTRAASPPADDGHGTGCEAMMAIRIIKCGDIVVVEGVERCGHLTPVPPQPWYSVICAPIGPRYLSALTADPKLRSIAILGSRNTTQGEMYEVWTASDKTVVIDLVEEIKRRCEAVHPILSFAMHSGKVRAVLSPCGLQLEDVCFVEESSVLSVSILELLGSAGVTQGSPVAAAISKLSISRTDLLDAPKISKNVIYFMFKQNGCVMAVAARFKPAFPGIKVTPHSASNTKEISMKITATFSVEYGTDVSAWKGLRMSSCPQGHLERPHSAFLHKKVSEVPGNKVWEFGPLLCCRPPPSDKGYAYFCTKGWTCTTTTAGTASITLSSKRLAETRIPPGLTLTMAKVTVDFGDRKLRSFVEQSIRASQRYVLRADGTTVDFLAECSSAGTLAAINAIVKAASDLRKALEPLRLPLAGLTGKAVAQYLQKNPLLCETQFPNVLLRFPSFDLKPHPTYTITCQGDAMGCQAVAKLCWDIYAQFTEYSRMVPLTGALVKTLGGSSVASALRNEPTFAMDMMCVLVGGIDATSRDRVTSLFSEVSGGIDFTDSDAYCCRTCGKAADVVLERCGHLTCHDCIATLLNGTDHSDPIQCPVQGCCALLSRLDVTDDSLFESLAYRQLDAKSSSQTTKGVSDSLLRNARCCPNCLLGFLRLSAVRDDHAPCSVCPSLTCVKCRKSHVGGQCSDFDAARDSQSIAKVLERIFLEGEAFVRKDASCSGLLLERNPCLAKNSPALVSFLKGLAAFGARSSGVFAWHGTPSIAGIQGICHGNLDVTRRSGQAHGPGEYFGVNPSVSFSYAKSTNAVILFYLLQTRYLKHVPSFCYVINNPNQTEMYCLPVLVLRQRSIASPLLSGTCCVPMPLGATSLGQRFFDDSVAYPFRFRWDAKMNRTQMTEYSDWAVQGKLNSLWEDSTITKAVVKICRDNDKVLEDYEIDFTAMTQRNMTTGYVRSIDRIRCVAPTLDATRNFQYKEERTGSTGVHGGDNAGAAPQSLLFSREDQEVLKRLYNAFLASPPGSRQNAAVTARLTVVGSEKRRAREGAAFRIHFGTMAMRTEDSAQTFKLFLG